MSPSDSLTGAGEVRSAVAVAPCLAPAAERQSYVRELLEALPDWFGIATAVDAYVEFVADAPTWVARRDDVCLGFLATRRHFERSAEIEVMAVAPALHRQGVGRALVEAATADLRTDGVRILQVKTLDASRESPAYARTRRFYEGLGFERVQVFPTLWDPSNPALQLVRWLG